jgi:hypothetical protein
MPETNSGHLESLSDFDPKGIAGNFSILHRLVPGDSSSMRLRSRDGETHPAGITALAQTQQLSCELSDGELNAARASSQTTTTGRI